MWRGTPHTPPLHKHTHAHSHIHRQLTHSFHFSSASACCSWVLNRNRQNKSAFMTSLLRRATNLISLTNKLQNLQWLWCSIKQDINNITYVAWKWSFVALKPLTKQITKSTVHRLNKTLDIPHYQWKHIGALTRFLDGKKSGILSMGREGLWNEAWMSITS